MSNPSEHPDPIAALRKLAIECLARRDYSRAELERRLLRHNKSAQPATAITDLLDALTHSGALNEARYAETFVRERYRRGHGPLRIHHELKMRGTDAEVATAVLARYQPQWPALTARVRAKRFGAAPPADATERARQARFLQQRGFDADMVRQALAWSENDDSVALPLD